MLMYERGMHFITKEYNLIMSDTKIGVKKTISMISSGAALNCFSAAEN